ncbi:MAG: HNH endonuclease [Actinomycetota bacterium]
MKLSQLTDPDAVRKAIAEFDRVGRDAFLAVFGFGRASDYFVMTDGKRYDSKAIVGAAYWYQYGVRLGPSDFSGGNATVATRLEKLGFEVERPARLPDWTVDELMLALDLYLRTRLHMSYRPSSQVVEALSAELRSLRIHPSEVRSNPRFRNASSVSMKLHNLASIDPSAEGQGMSHSGSGDRRVWEEWAWRPNELTEAVAAIRALGTGDSAAGETHEDEEYEVPEGRVLFRAHRRYERNPQLVKRKKEAVLRATGRLACEVCGFESSEVFEMHGVIDVHHIVPLHVIGQGRTGLSDLALVCPTCHRVLHKHRPIVAPAELREKRRRLGQA